MSGDEHWHDHAHDHFHDHDQSSDDANDSAIAGTIWHLDNVELTTVGIDVGSATSHLAFSRLHLKRQAHGYSSRFVVVERRVLYQSRILLTPYLSDGLIDADALHSFFEDEYRAGGLDRDSVDAGAIILTGVALERENSRRIADLFAEEGGRFVCASAGHNLEALLAAHGSGAVALSTDDQPVLNVDVGGGTTKYALCERGQVIATKAIWGGARLLVVDDAGRVVRAEGPVIRIAGGLGIDLVPGAALTSESLQRIAAAIADAIVSEIGDSGSGEVLAGALPAEPRADRIVLSGGVAEYLGRDQPADHGDLGRELANCLESRLSALGLTVHSGSERIRATVIGASQFSVQVSGNTIHISGQVSLPIHNVPVVALDLDEDSGGTADQTAAAIDRRLAQLDLSEREGPVAMAIKWSGDPLYATLRRIADAVSSAHVGSSRRESPLMLVMEADIGASLGSILTQEVGLSNGVVAIDGIELSDLDFIDIGEPIHPTNVVPVVIKSLIFPHAGAERPRILGSA
jgi:ethanolamine utilization protein EutA